MALTITPQQQQQFQKEGYFILENIIPPEHLKLLRDAAQDVIDRSGTRSNRYVTEHNWREMPQLRLNALVRRAHPTLAATVKDDLL